MPPVGFEPTISAGERPQTYALDRAATGTGEVNKVTNIFLLLQPGHYSSLPAPNLQPTANQERNDQCGNQHYGRELLMMGVVVPETC